MFNLTNLITSCIIATGVATTTPVNNANNIPSIQADNIVANYNINFTQTTTQEQEYNIYNNNLGTLPFSYGNRNSDVDKESITKYTGTGYLTIKATKYTTKNILNGNLQDEYRNTLIQNYDLITNNLDNFYRKTTTNLLVIEVQPYNFNTNNNIKIYARLNVENQTQDLSFTWNVETRRYVKTVYQTTENWENYLNMQINPYNAYEIRTEIENINNSFQYTKNRTITNNITVASDQGYIINDDTNITLTPNVKNYIVIEYMPVITGYYTYNNQDYNYANSDQVIPGHEIATGISEEPYRISGTNIIPDNDYEVIDIPGLMWQIITMPFAFVSQAFNLTLFPGTPYQLNISNLFLSIIAVAVFIWLISFFLKMKG